MRMIECHEASTEAYEGYMQTDGYGGYTSWLDKPDQNGIIHAACWAHARRKFVEVTGNSSARKIAKLIAKLYRTETGLRQNPQLDRAAYPRR